MSGTYVVPPADLAEAGPFPMTAMPPVMAIPIGEHGGKLLIPERLAAEGEPLYTLGEARLELAQRECSLTGHTIEVIVDGRGEVTGIVCSNRCGHRGWRVTPIGDVDPRAMLRDVAVDLWHDLAAAYGASDCKPRETSVACHGLIKRIQDIARVVGPVAPGDLEYEMLLTGLYETVHAEVGVDVHVPDGLLTAARAYVEAGGELRDGRTRGLYSENRDRRVYFGTDPDGARYYLATDRAGWLPGEYATPEAAEAAFDAPRECLEGLANNAIDNGRRIEVDDITRVMSEPLKLADAAPAAEG
ncbi:hypothetical protein [Nonomuraea sp. NEAU-A123]|uniref:hypothetical protein n=1 Tax=Nonomuraea sp. NEAU-A123 TaxID=2839649 RepID=UPI001BE43B3B|nr:hypothetical protein [Nonomuraea sp. NEAU-A123]MBT2226269.1 hypothetical protein [Nonomuraea sp. NEAU-A123]